MAQKAVDTLLDDIVWCVEQGWETHDLMRDKVLTMPRKDLESISYFPSRIAEELEKWDCIVQSCKQQLRDWRADPVNEPLWTDG